MNKIKYISIITIIMLTGCASNPHQKESVPGSFLNSTTSITEALTTEVTNAELLANPPAGKTVEDKRFRFVPPMKLHTSDAKSVEDILNQFSDKDLLTVTAEDLPLNEYLHQVLGELLQVSYILSDDIKNDSQAVTLNLQTPVTQRKLFTLTEELLTQRNYIIRFDDNVFYIHKDNGQNSGKNVVFGYGNTLNDVPQSSLDIVQMVPFEFGLQVSLGNTLRQLFGVSATPDLDRSSMVIQGKRRDIIRSLELVRMMDQPTLQNRQIGIYKSVFLSTPELITTVTELLAQEGITVGKGRTKNVALSIVELDKQGELILFANSLSVIERAVYWAEQVDKPLKSAGKTYFVYQPQYSRAVDMGESLGVLIGGASGNASSGPSSSTSAASQNQGTSNIRGASSKDLDMVIDERSNSLIFFTSGDSYQQLLPLIKRLDVLPKQIMLEVMIAEITLTDEFKSGVEFLLTNQGNASAVGGFDLRGAGTGLSYVLTGALGNLNINLSQSNDKVNVLSRPSLLVRDGVTANINVGNDIPTIGEIVTSPDVGSQTSVVYRKTGVDLKVKPTVNARGVIIMEIAQKISNETSGGSSVAGSPIIFERSITTEVIAESGQTIILGGLMSENKSLNDTTVPFFSSIPLLGMLFDTQEESINKTELVILVTPKVIESTNEWDDIKAKFSKLFNELLIQ